MKIAHPAALFLIAACALSTGAQAAKVYKCGASYSQVPCADGVELNTADEPSAQQQRAARKTAERDEKAASALEKKRLEEEKTALKAQQAAAKAGHPADAVTEKEKSKGKKKSKKEPEFFTAKVPSTKASQPQ